MKATLNYLFVLHACLYIYVHVYIGNKICLNQNNKGLNGDICVCVRVRVYNGMRHMYDVYMHISPLQLIYATVCLVLF